MSEGATRRRYVGQPVRRVGDERLVTGAGRFVDDIHLPGTVHAALVRSPYPHAILRRVDRSAAEAAPGVVAVLTGQDIAAWVRPQVVEAELLPGRSLRRYPLALDRVRHVGDPVAVVVAESPYAARDAAERVAVDYEPLPAVVDPREALAPDAPRLYPEWGDNVAFRWEVESGDLADAFARADRVVEVDLVNQRVYAAFVEPRAVLASYDPARQEMTIWASTQVPHSLRSAIAAMLDLPEHRLRVVAPDVGGAFGSKGGVYVEYILAAAPPPPRGRPPRMVYTP
ncbi:MAG: xanthine dehydrogenase family protein molybdopterin-binding subunit, partial [Thermomicrobiaceae bacterium]|nr:xanthine dehydrogenase family protein molybdopterin-binding subunit [Thermomicrobiaceae bacterium]